MIKFHRNIERFWYLSKGKYKESWQDNSEELDDF